MRKLTYFPVSVALGEFDAALLGKLCELNSKKISELVRGLIRKQALQQKVTVDPSTHAAFVPAGSLPDSALDIAGADDYALRAPAAATGAKAVDFEARVLALSHGERERVRRGLADARDNEPGDAADLERIRRELGPVALALLDEELARRAAKPAKKARRKS